MTRVSLDDVLRRSLERTDGNLDLATDYLISLFPVEKLLQRAIIQRVLTIYKASAKADGGQATGASDGQNITAADNSSDAGQSESARSQCKRAPSLETQPWAAVLADGEGHRARADGANEVLPTAREPISVNEAGRVLQTARKPGAGALRPEAYAFRQQVRGESWLLSHRLAINDRPFMSFGVGEIRPMAQRTVREGALIMRDLVLLYATEQVVKKRRLQPEQQLGKTLTPADIAEIEQAVDSDATVKAATTWIKDFAKEHVPQLESANG